MEWLACRALTGKEYFVRRKIKELAPEAEIIVPRTYTKEIKNGTIKNRSERMLPGYLLIGTPDVLDRDKLKNFVKVIGKVSEDEIASIKATQGDKSDILVDGMNVIVVDGPFQGCKGKILKQVSEGKMNCRVVFQGIELFVDLDPKILSSLTSNKSEDESEDNK